jgi:putative endonuclease
MTTRTYRFYVYILASSSGTLYIGVTNDLSKRVWQHKNHLIEGFTSKYNVDRLVYFEEFVDVRNAIRREKQLRGWTRKKKVALFEKQNPKWIDLSRGWFDDDRGRSTPLRSAHDDITKTEQ